MHTSLPQKRTDKIRPALRSVLTYLGYYFLGIVSCVVFTPVDAVLAGTVIWPYFPLFAPFGFVAFYSSLPSQYVFGATVIYWVICIAGPLFILLGLAATLRPLRQLKSWRPFLIGFPLGFVGTLGCFYAIAASI